MAKIAFSALISNARGKLGGGVFTRTRSGSNIRTRVKPKNPRTVTQSQVRANLTDAARLAKGMTAVQVTSWKSYASGLTKHQSVSGQAYAPAWINAFTALASKFLQVTPGGTVPTSPPASPYAGDTITVTPTAGSGTLTFTGSADNTSGSTTEILIQSLKSANRQPTPKGYRTHGFSAVPHGTPVVISSLPHGSVYATAYRFVDVATGQETLIYETGVFTVT